MPDFRHNPEPSDIRIKGPYTATTFNVPLLPKVINVIFT